MNIRSLTIGAALPTDEAARASFITRLGDFARMGRAALEGAGFTVQTTRIATPPLERWLFASGATEVVTALDRAFAGAGINYWSLGTIQASSDTAGETDPLQRALPEMLLAAPNAFASVQVGDRLSGGVNLSAVHNAAAIIKSLASETEHGFGNLRFAAAANCPPHVPFFPASYYVEDEMNEGGPEFGIALEAADLAVQALQSAQSHEEARSNLLALLVEGGERVAQVCAGLAAEHAYRFTGLDLSMAPYPDPDRSIARALEMLIGGPLGSPGTVAAAAHFTGTLRDARLNLPAVGYSGLMLPALEDQTLADRAAEGLVTLDTLLLLSAVCGLGLDTVPLPGDISQRQIERIILDMAALAVRLDKPLTARLFPVPGKAAGDPAEWPDFPYFARGKVMSVPEAPEGETGLLLGGWMAI